MHPLIKRIVHHPISGTESAEIDESLFANSCIINSIPYHKADSHENLNKIIKSCIENNFIILLVHEWHNETIGVRLLNVDNYPSNVINLSQKQEKSIAKKFNEPLKFDKDLKFIIVFENRDDFLLANTTNCFGFNIHA